MYCPGLLLIFLVFSFFLSLLSCLFFFVKILISIKDVNILWTCAPLLVIVLSVFSPTLWLVSYPSKKFLVLILSNLSSPWPQIKPCTGASLSAICFVTSVCLSLCYCNHGSFRVSLAVRKNNCSYLFLQVSFSEFYQSEDIAFYTQFAAVRFLSRADIEFYHVYSVSIDFSPYLNIKQTTFLE